MNNVLIIIFEHDLVSFFILKKKYDKYDANNENIFQKQIRYTKLLLSKHS